MNVVMNTSVTIASPGFPSAYPVDVEECWTRTPSCGHQVQLEFTRFDVSFVELVQLLLMLFYYQVLGEDAHITLKPPVNAVSKYSGNSFNYAEAPPKIISFPADTAVEVCFTSGAVVNGHVGFSAELTETPATDWITSPNYPENINDNNLWNDYK